MMWCSKFKQLLSVCLLLGSLSISVWGQTLSRIAESREPTGTDYTGEIRQFSEIGPAGPGTTPRPWVCYTHNTDDIVWQGPGGSNIPTGTGQQVTTSELFTVVIGSTGVALLRGPDYNSPDGEYCCVRTTTDERRCVTLTPCPMLPTLNNGMISYNAATNQATYNCDTGYRVSGTSPITCDEGTMQWSPALPSCELIVCPTLPHPGNGRVIVNGNQRLGDTATYSCNPGYTLTGSATRVCGADSQWTLTAPTCEPITCSALPAISENGMPIVYFSDTTEPYDYGTTATYMCDSGYELTGGNAVRTCTGDGSSATGQWSGTAPTCSIVDCGPPIVPENGDVTLPTGETTFNSVATYSCDSCYELDGVSTSVCGEDGVWVPSAPTCIVFDCGVPDSPTNGQFQTSSGNECGSVATYTCDAGYDLVGVRTRTCQNNEEWTDEAPICRAVDCGALSDPDNGRVDTSSGTTFTSTAIYTCNDGYLPRRPVTRTCNADRQWRPAPPTCDPVDCGSLTNPLNGLVDTSSGTILMSIALYECNTGYNLNGTRSATCEPNGIWSPAAPSCEIVDCGEPPAPQNGRVDTIESGTTYQSVATHSCEVGYYLIGSFTRTCMANGDWSLSLPSCAPVDCGDLQSPSNGHVYTPQGTLYTANATYSCDSGYNLTGCAAAECLASGSWSCDPPYCADNAMIQLKFSRTTNCVDWTEEKVLLMYQLMHSLIHEAVEKGGHVIPKENIQRGYFSCFGSTTETTYRTTITGIERVTAVDYAGVIQEWVESGVTTRVQWYVIKIDKNCPVSIMSMDDDECV